MAAIIGGYAVTQADHDAETIHACVVKKDKFVRIVETPPTATGRPKSPSSGTKKAQARGATGLQGEQGAQGEQGIQGAGHHRLPESMNGLACVVNGAAGTVAVTVEPSRAVSLLQPDAR
jgi:hypothetical protein